MIIRQKGKHELNKWTLQKEKQGKYAKKVHNYCVICLANSNHQQNENTCKYTPNGSFESSLCFFSVSFLQHVFKSKPFSHKTHAHVSSFSTQIHISINAPSSMEWILYSLSFQIQVDIQFMCKYISTNCVHLMNIAFVRPIKELYQPSKMSVIRCYRHLPTGFGSIYVVISIFLLPFSIWMLFNEYE